LNGLLSGPTSANTHNLGKPPALASRKKNTQPGIDSIAIAPSGFRSLDKDLENEQEFWLPIEVWALGTRVIESVTSEDPQPQHWFCVRGKKISVLSHPIEQTNSMCEFELEDIINLEVVCEARFDPA